MEKIITFKNPADAVNRLDNGGRFYNIFTEPNDQVISLAEVGKVAGLFFEKQRAVLFLEMTISKLNESAKQEVMATFDEDLLQAYAKFRPQWLLPSEVAAKGTVSSSAIITGVPRFKEKNSGLSGFVFIPAGKVFIMVPIFEQYDVYEISDEESSETFIIAHKKGEEKLPTQKIRVGGVLKEMNADKDNDKVKNKFLEVSYFIDEIAWANLPIKKPTMQLQWPTS